MGIATFYHGPAQRQGAAGIPGSRGAEADEGLHAVVPELGAALLHRLCERLYQRQVDGARGELCVEVLREVLEAQRACGPALPGTEREVEPGNAAVVGQLL